MIKKYNYNNDNTKDLRVFEGLKEICTRMQENLTKHINIFRLRLKPFLRYECNNMWTLKEVIDIRNKIHWEYAKQSYPILTGGASKTGVM